MNFYDWWDSLTQEQQDDLMDYSQLEAMAQAWSACEEQCAELAAGDSI